MQKKTKMYKSGRQISILFQGQEGYNASLQAPPLGDPALGVFQ